MNVPSFQNYPHWLKSGIGSYWMSRGTYQLQATSEPGYRISIRGSLPKDGSPLHAGMVKTDVFSNSELDQIFLISNFFLAFF